MSPAPAIAPAAPRAAVSTAVFRDGQVLLAQRSKPPFRGMWSLPGGHIHAGEKAAAAARRELLEETGVEAELLGVADVADVILRDADSTLRAHYVLTVFYGTWRAGEPCAASDCMGVCWAAPDALDSRPLMDGSARIIRKAHGLLTGVSGPA